MESPADDTHRSGSGSTVKVEATPRPKVTNFHSIADLISSSCRDTEIVGDENRRRMTSAKQPSKKRKQDCDNSDRHRKVSDGDRSVEDCDMRERLTPPPSRSGGIAPGYSPSQRSPSDCLPLSQTMWSKNPRCEAQTALKYAGSELGHKQQTLTVVATDTAASPFLKQSSQCYTESGNQRAPWEAKAGGQPGIPLTPPTTPSPHYPQEGIIYINPETTDKSRSKGGKTTRTIYKTKQVFVLEQIFSKTQYPEPEVVEMLARDLEITENKIKVWFQNKRARCRRRASDNSSSPQNTSGPAPALPATWHPAIHGHGGDEPRHPGRAALMSIPPSVHLHPFQMSHFSSSTGSVAPPQGYMDFWPGAYPTAAVPTPWYITDPSQAAIRGGMIGGYPYYGPHSLTSFAHQQIPHRSMIVPVSSSTPNSKSTASKKSRDMPKI